MEIDEDAWRELTEVLRKLREGAMLAQSEATAARQVTQELLIDLAKLQPDPDGYVRDLYDRVCERVDPLRRGGEKGAMGDARLLIDQMFRKAAEALQNPPPASKRPPA